MSSSSFNIICSPAAQFFQDALVAALDRWCVLSKVLCRRNFHAFRSGVVIISKTSLTKH